MGARTAPPSAAWDMAGLMYRLDKVRRGISAVSGLGSADGRLLWLLSDEVPRTLRQIAEELALEQSTVNRQVNAALAHGLLRRHRDAGGPAYLVSATADGQARLQRGIDLTIGLHEQALATLSPADQRRVTRDLDRLMTSYEQALGGV